MIPATQSGAKLPPHPKEACHPIRTKAAPVWSVNQALSHYRNLLPTGTLLREAKARVQGHLNYYAITDNAESCQRYMQRTRRALFTWLNRRNQCKSYIWAAFQQALRHVGWPQGRIRVNLNPFATLNG